LKERPNIIDYKNIEVGQTYKFEHAISEDDVKQYAKIIGDFNPLHLDKEYAKTTIYKKRIVHGMLTSSLFSTLLGMYCPGKNSIILSMDTSFKRPVFTGTRLQIRGEVTRKIHPFRIILMKLTVSDGKNILVEGKAKVKKI